MHEISRCFGFDLASFDTALKKVLPLHGQKIDLTQRAKSYISVCFWTKRYECKLYDLASVSVTIIQRLYCMYLIESSTIRLKYPGIQVSREFTVKLFGVRVLIAIIHIHSQIIIDRMARKQEKLHPTQKHAIETRLSIQTKLYESSIQCRIPRKMGLPSLPKQ